MFSCPDAQLAGLHVSIPWWVLDLYTRADAPACPPKRARLHDGPPAGGTTALIWLSALRRASLTPSKHRGQPGEMTSQCLRTPA
jgi:hypothetical protein